MNDQDSIYILAERIAKAELAIGIAENRVRNPSAFERKVRDNMLERVQQRGTGWLVEQGNRFGVDIPAQLQKHQPTRDEIAAKKPAICRTCGIALAYDPVRRIEIVDGWPFAVSPCARGKGEATTIDCYTYQERSELGLIRPYLEVPSHA
jgi:hypothetical protein